MNKQTSLLPLFLFTFFAMPASAIVITSVSINGVQLVSEASSTAFGLPSNLMIASNHGGFLFNFGLASDPSQNPDETILGAVPQHAVALHPCLPVIHVTQARLLTLVMNVDIESSLTSKR